MIIPESLFLLFFGATVVFTLTSALGTFLYRPFIIPEEPAGRHNRVAILIPAYKEDSVILHTVKAMRHLSYPDEKYDIFVVADSFKKETLQNLRDLNIANVIEVNFQKSTKSKALNYCLENINTEDFDLVLISDADNILEKDFLQKVNAAYNAGYEVIQAHRTAKNLNNSVAVLDAMSEEINNNLYRKGQNGLGLSSCLIGSGIVAPLPFFKRINKAALDSFGEDRILQLKAVEYGKKIHYLESALVFDEKVSDFGNFENQRKRWLANQFKYLFGYFPKAFKRLIKGDFDYFSMAIINNLFLPRVLNLGLLLLLFLLHLILPVDNLWRIAWGALFLLYTIALFIAIPKYFFQKDLFWKALLNLPRAFVSMFLLLFRLKSANKKFINTEHKIHTVDNSILSRTNEDK